MNPKVVIVMVSPNEEMRPEVASAIRHLDCPLVRYVAPRIHGLHLDPEKNRCINIANARNMAREMALKHDATHYLFVDDDIVPPPHTIKSLLSHNKLAIGGWFQIINLPFWVGGRWVADNVFAHYTFPQPSVVRTDLLSMGCALLAREVFQAYSYAPGIDRFCRTLDGRYCHLADSGDYSNKLLDADIQPYLDGDVICKHLN